MQKYDALVEEGTRPIINLPSILRIGSLFNQMKS